MAHPAPTFTLRTIIALTCALALAAIARAAMAADFLAATTTKQGAEPNDLPFRHYVAQARLGVSRAEHDGFFRQMLKGQKL